MSYSAQSSILHDMTDLPPAPAGQEQVVPLTHARGPSLAFLLDCIVEAEKRKAAGVWHIGDNAAAGDDEDDAGDSSGAESENESPGTPSDPFATYAAGFHQAASHPRPPVKKGPAQTPPSYTGLPSGRGVRNRAKAEIFSRAPMLPRLAETAESTKRSGLLETQPPDDEEGGWSLPNDWKPVPWGAADEAESSPADEAGQGEESDSATSMTEAPRPASAAPSTAASTSSFATAVTGVWPAAVAPPASDPDSEPASEATVTVPLQPALALHAPTFEEVLDVMIAFELDSLKRVIFDGLKASTARHHTTPGREPTLPAEYLYAFACKYEVGNRSYWATRCLESAWRAGLVPGAAPLDRPRAAPHDRPRAAPLDRPRVRFIDLDIYPLSLLDNHDFDALKNMFGRFNRAFSIFAASFTGTPPSDGNTKFGRACAQCPVKTEHGSWSAFKRALLREHVAELVITDPQFMRKRDWLSAKIRQFIACTRCADRIIHMTLHLWKRFQTEAWSFKRKHRTPSRFGRKSKGRRVRSHLQAAQMAAATPALLAPQQHQPPPPPPPPQSAAQMSAILASAGITATTTATGTGYTTVWHLPSGGQIQISSHTVSHSTGAAGAGGISASSTAQAAPAPSAPAPPAPAPAAPAPAAPAPAVPAPTLAAPVAPAAAAAPAAAPAAAAPATTTIAPAAGGWSAPPPFFPNFGSGAPAHPTSANSNWSTQATTSSTNTGWGAPGPAPALATPDSDGWGSPPAPEPAPSASASSSLGTPGPAPALATSASSGWGSPPPAPAPPSSAPPAPSTAPSRWSTPPSGWSASSMINRGSPGPSAPASHWRASPRPGSAAPSGLTASGAEPAPPTTSWPSSSGSSSASASNQHSTSSWRGSTSATSSQTPSGWGSASTDSNQPNSGWGSTSAGSNQHSHQQSSGSGVSGWGSS